MEAPGNIKFNNSKGLTELYKKQLGWIDSANKAIQETLGLPDGPFPFAGDEIEGIEMLSRAIEHELSEVKDYIELWAKELKEGVEQE